MTAKTVRVFLVDDQESFRSAARLVVDMAEGFELVGEAGSGEEAFDLVAATEPDLVLMDIGLPGIDGLEATRRLGESHPRARVIVLSTYEASEYEPRALATGALAFISKEDFGPDLLRQMWESVADG